MRATIELYKNFWNIRVGDRVRAFSDLDRALEILRKELVKEVRKWEKRRG